MQRGITKNQFLQLCADLWDRESATTNGPVNCEFRINVQGRQVTKRRVHFDGTETLPECRGFAAMTAKTD